jgi:hypothetical protein
VTLTITTALAPCRVERALAITTAPTTTAPTTTAPTTTAPTPANTAPIPAPPLKSGGGALDLAGSPTATPPTVGLPTQIDIPAIAVHARVLPLGLDRDGTVQVPGRYDVTGWYQGGPRPGDAGPAVILGHLDSLVGPAVFLRLGRLVPGQVITVSSLTDAHRFRVDSVATFAKDRFPTSLVYGPVPGPALRLVTCGGTFDDARHSYRANVVVFATELLSP